MVGWPRGLRRRVANSLGSFPRRFESYSHRLQLGFGMARWGGARYVLGEVCSVDWRGAVHKGLERQGKVRLEVACYGTARRGQAYKP